MLKISLTLPGTGCSTIGGKGVGASGGTTGPGVGCNKTGVKGMGSTLGGPGAGTGGVGGGGLLGAGGRGSNWLAVAVLLFSLC